MFYEIQMAIGHHRSDGEPLPLDRIEAAKNLGLLRLKQILPGGRVIDGNGWHTSADGRCRLEPCSLLTACTTKVSKSHRAKLLRVARMIATELEQECVLVTIQRVDGTMHWVKPDASTRERGEQAA